MTDSRTLIVNTKSGCVHHKSCGSVNYGVMDTMPARLFLTLEDERRYTEERGWVPCRSCWPFNPLDEYGVVIRGDAREGGTP